MRRGEITALRWRSIDLDAGQLAVVASTEQTKAGCREKDANRAKAEHLAAHPEGAGRERAILYRTVAANLAQVPYWGVLRLGVNGKSAASTRRAAVIQSGGELFSHN